MSTFPLSIKTFAGLEEVLAQEINKLGASKVKVGRRVVCCEGDKQVMYRANLCLRTALRVLKPIGEFKVRDEKNLYKEVGKIPWENYLSVNHTFAVDSTVNSDHFSHSKYVALKTKDAIVDRLRDLYGTRPSIDTENPSLRINIRISQENCTISLDSSGDSLHKRGYRKSKGRAPINESLAAGMLMLAGWNGKTNFVDPMCGSGTLLIEAAMLAGNIPSRMQNLNFGFMKWKDYDEKLWESVLQKAKEEIIPINVEIYGSDSAFRAVEASRENIRNAKLDEVIAVTKTPIDEMEPPPAPGLMVTNPPYGERIQPDDLVGLYKSIGDVLKQKYSGYNAWLISSDIAAMKHIGLRPSRKIPLINGALECSFRRFELYAGTKKIHKLKQNTRND